MNKMTMRHFYDFYYLEALRAGMSMAISANPEIEFKHSFERLRIDVEKEFTKVTTIMAERIRFYLWAACLGEARHAHDRCEQALEEISDGESRHSVFNKANNFPVTSENLDSVCFIFGQEWGGAYGGRAWLNIANAIRLYDEVSPATFIDYAIDLEHNGGNVFTKSQGQYEPVNLNVDDQNEIGYFLNFKFAKDILTDKYHNDAQVTTRTYNLLQRYNNVVSKVRMDNLKTYRFNETLDAFDVEFGDEELTVTEAGGGLRCADCGDKIDPEDHAHNPDEECICESCADNYATCEKCDKHFDNSDIVEVEGWSVCENCAMTKLGAVKCNDCGDWTTEYIMTEDSYDYYCGNCQDGLFCNKCDEYHDDMKWHNEHEHAEEEERSDIEIKAQVEKSTDDETVYVYYECDGQWLKHWASPCTPKLSIIALNTMDEGTKTELVTKERKTFKMFNGKETTQEVYSCGSLFVYNLKKVDRDEKYEWGIMSKAKGLYFCPTNDWNKAVEVMVAVQKIIDWSKVTTGKKWAKVAKKYKAQILKEVLK